MARRKRHKQPDAEEQRARLIERSWRKYREATTDHLRRERLGDLVELYRPWVRQRATRVLRDAGPAAADHDDLVLEGLVALVQAIERFDSSRGTLFLQFAFARVTGAMRDCLRVINHLSRRHQTQVRRGSTPAVQVTSLDAPRGPASGRAAQLSAVLEGREPGPDCQMETVEFWWSATRGLPAPERLVIFGMLRDGLTQRDLAGFLGVTRHHVSRLYQRAIGVLNQRQDREQLADQLPDGH